MSSDSSSSSSDDESTKQTRRFVKNPKLVWALRLLNQELDLDTFERLIGIIDASDHVFLTQCKISFMQGFLAKLREAETYHTKANLYVFGIASWSDFVYVVHRKSEGTAKFYEWVQKQTWMMSADTKKVARELDLLTLPKRRSRIAARGAGQRRNTSFADNTIIDAYKALQKSLHKGDEEDEELKRTMALYGFDATPSAPVVPSPAVSSNALATNENPSLVTDTTSAKRPLANPYELMEEHYNSSDYDEV